MRVQWIPGRVSSFLVVGLLFLASMGAGSVALLKLQALDDLLIEDAVWASFQLDRELKSLRIALLDATPETLPEVRLTYDILYSRISVLESGQVAELIQQIELRDYNIDDLLASIKALDDDIYGLTAETLGSMRDPINQILREIQAGTGTLVVATNLHFGRERQENREAQATLIRAVLGLASLTMVAGLFLIRQLRQQQKSLRSRQAALSASNDQLEQARQAAEEASQAKTDFMAVLSHEVRTPLNGIFGLTNLLEYEVADTPRARHYLETLRASTDAVSTVVNDILDYSHLQAGKLSLAPHPFSLDDFLRTLCQGYELQARERSAAFECYIPEALGTVDADPDRLRQVLMNLLNNAFKFTDSGRVTLSVDAESQDDVLAIRFDVIDTGCGISDEAQARLFQPFSQVDKSLTRRRQGSGLGLVISEELVEAMGSRIELDSQPGKGSRFGFRLALPRTDPVAGSTPSRSENADLAARLLLVEDNPVNQMVAREQLTRIGHDVSVVADGAQALDYLGHERFDLVLMDMQMPVMDGLEATRRLRARGETLPILAMTANATAEDAQRCLESGMQAVIKKPVDIAELQDKIQRHLAA